MYYVTMHAFTVCTVSTDQLFLDLQTPSFPRIFTGEGTIGYTWAAIVQNTEVKGQISDPDWHLAMLTCGAGEVQGFMFFTLMEA